MNDLTHITGIGPATARALAVAGIGSIPALAQADPAALAAHEAFRGLRAGLGDLEGWIAQAQGIAGKPVALMVSDTQSGEDSAKADPADSAEPPQQPPEPELTPGATGADEADATVLPSAPAQSSSDLASLEQRGPDLAGFTLIVTGPKRGRRRAGMEFNATPRRIKASDLTPRQIEALRDDPALKVEIEETAAAD